MLSSLLQRAVGRIPLPGRNMGNLLANNKELVYTLCTTPTPHTTVGSVFTPSWFGLPLASAANKHASFSQASLNFDDPTLEALLEALPEAPAAARRQCLKACGLDDPDEY